jgi:hypothetical protein
MLYLMSELNRTARRGLKLASVAGASLILGIGANGCGSHKSHALPRLPQGHVNFNPNFSFIDGFQTTGTGETNTTGNPVGIMSGDVKEGVPLYIGYAKAIGSGTLRLLVGARVDAVKGGISIEPLYGSKEDIKISEASLDEKYAIIPLGGDYSLESQTIGETDGAIGVEVNFGTTQQVTKQAATW